MKLFRRSSSNTLLPSEEWIIVLASLWFVGGLYVDGWAHNHLDSSLETFFTPWHALFYSGYAVLTLSLLFITWQRKTPKSSWMSAIPKGYGWSVAGAAVFFVGGIGDMIWHQVFGIEADIDALLSPTHLLLAIGLLLMVTGPLRAWLARTSASAKETLVSQLPMLFSLAFTLSLLTFMTQYNHFIELRPAGTLPTDPDMAERIRALAITGYLFQTMLLMGCIFLVQRAGKIAWGGFTLLCALNVLAMAFMRDGLVIVLSGLAAGLVADYYAAHARPVAGNERSFRIFAFIVPFALFLAYFLEIMFLFGGTWWTIHLWTGSIVIAGIAGLLLSYAFLPPKEK